MNFQITQNKSSRQYHFVLTSGNGQTILTSQGYKAKQSAKRGIASVQKNIILPHRFYSKSKRNGQVYFHLKARNGEIIADSQLYPDEHSLQRSIKSLIRSVPKAKIIDLTRKA